MKYKAIVTIHWDLETSDSDPFRVAREEIQKYLPPDVEIKVKIDKLRRAKNKMICVGEFSPEEVLPYVSFSEEEKREYVVGSKSYLVRMNSHRYFIFRASQNCVACGLKGTKMLLEQHPSDSSPHFNLYGVEEDQLVLMTKDHIHAKSLGGEDRHSNYQTMCAICNNLKGSDNLTLDSIAELRKIYNENNKKHSRKKVSDMVRHAREKLKLPPVAMVPSPNIEGAVELKADIYIMEDKNGDLNGVLVYESVKEGYVSCVAGIHKGTKLVPIASEDRKLVFPFNDRVFRVYSGLVEK